MSNELILKDNRKPYIYFSIIIVLLFALLYFGFSHTLSNYLHAQITSEAVALAKSNSTSILTLDTSVNTLQNLLVNQLRNVAELLITTSSPDNVGRNTVLSGSHLIDKINWISQDGVVIYSSDNFEGHTFGPDHFFWEVVNGDQEYTLTNAIIDDDNAETEDYFLLLYAKANDGSVVQVGVLTDRLNELVERFSVDNLMKITMENESVTYASVYIDSKSGVLSFLTSDASENLNDSQVELLLSQEELSRQATFNVESVLEVYTPIHDENNQLIGSFLLVYSLSDINNFVQLSSFGILAFLFMITALFLTLTIVLYKRDVQISEASYVDSETNILNGQYIRDNFNELKANRGTEDSSIAVFLISNFRRSQLLSSHTEMVTNLNQFVSILRKYSEGGEIYRYADDFFFMFSHKRSEQEIMRSINNVYNDKRLNYEIKAAIIMDAASSETVDDLFETCKVTRMKLRESSGSNEIVITKDIQEELIKRQLIERDLRLLSVRGFANELFVVFHPQIDIVNGEIVGFETLTRWIHPEHGFISPPLIFEIAENSDYYNSLTRWILTQALEFIQKLNAAGFTKQIVSINAPNEYVLHPDSISNIKSVLDLYGVSPTQLGFEITESHFDDSITELRDKVHQLNELGITTYIDDYGRGYSSMLRLRDLDVNVLKIDKTFVDDINKDERFLNSIIKIANDLNLEIVAEGAENAEQVEWLKAHNCNVVQGFYFSKPLKASEALEFTKNYKP